MNTKHNPTNNGFNCSNKVHVQRNKTKKAAWWQKGQDNNGRDNYGNPIFKVKGTGALLPCHGGK